MKRLGRILVLFVAFLLLLLLIGPLVIPVPPLKGTVPAEQLADPDSLFVEVDGLTVHYKRAGQGEPLFILLHGFGASLFSWREVMAPLSQSGTVIAFDRPAFGLTERPMPGEWQGESPYSAAAQVDLTLALMDTLDVPEAILVGNSAGGTIAMLTALRAPERVQALILVSPAVYGGGGAPSWVRFLSGLPVPWLRSWKALCPAPGTIPARSRPRCWPATKSRCWSRTGIVPSWSLSWPAGGRIWSSISTVSLCRSWWSRGTTTAGCQLCRACA